MKIEFQLDIPTFSINKKHCRDQRYVTAEYKDWSTKIQYLLDDVKLLTDLALQFKAQGGVFSLELHAVYPGSVYYTKDRNISSKVHDLSNWEKVLCDELFNRMDVNDKFITRLTSTKRAGSHHYIEIKMQLLR